MKKLLLLSGLAMSQLINAQNLITNGDFEQGNGSFYSQYQADCNAKAGWFPNSPIVNEEYYCVTTNSGQFTALAGWKNCTNHTTGGNNIMVINGSTTKNEKLWCQQINNIQPNTLYKFSTFGTSILSTNPAKLQFSINGSLLGNEFQLTSKECDWNQFYEIWNSGTATSADICIVNQNTISNGNDFALDDISFIEVGLTMPNVFTPDGDGQNDTYHPFTFKEIDKYEFVIYDRWGIKVYEQKEEVSTKQPEWNGKFNGTGGDAASGTYYWVLNYETSIVDVSVAKTLTGFLTLIK